MPDSVATIRLSNKDFFELMISAPLFMINLVFYSGVLALGGKSA
jgi:hypothetical protein